MKINFDSEDSKVIKSNETYDVIDNTNLKNLIVSKTILHPKKNTSGHNHSGQEEVYIFTNGPMKANPILDISFSIIESIAKSFGCTKSQSVSGGKNPN